MMSSRESSSSSGSKYARFAGNTLLRELGCYIDLGRTAFEVPRIEVGQNHIVGAHKKVGRRDIPQWAVLDFNSKLIDLNFGDNFNMSLP